MRSVTVITLLVFAGEAHANINANIRHQYIPSGIFTKQKGLQASPPFQRFPQDYSPQVRPIPQSSVAAGAFRVAGEAEDAKADRQQWIADWRASQVESMAGGDFSDPTKNVFGGDIQTCASLECEYTGENPEMCIQQVPRQREDGYDPGAWAGNNARSFILQRSEESKLWNDDLESSAQCLSLWSWVEDTGTDFGAWLQYGNTDLVPKCSALPQSVLGSEYTMETYATCEYEVRQYKYVSPNSPNYKAGGNSVVTKNDPFYINKPSLNQKPLRKMSQRCERFRNVIDGICNVCEAQADAKGKGVLQSQCSKLKLTGPPEGDEREAKWLPFKVFRRGMPWNAGKNMIQIYLDVMNVPIAALTGLLVGGGAMLVMVRHGASTTVKEPLLAA